MSTNVLTLVDQRSLTYLSQQELDDLYRRSVPGEIPAGNAHGIAIFAPDTTIGRLLTRLVTLFVWQGKVFDPATKELKNKISPFGFRAIRAQVYKQNSWLDGKPTIVLDYSKTSFLAQKIRDEIREVAPGVYLGKVWWGKRRVIDFALRF
jgi:hypothetical protein